MLLRKNRFAYQPRVAVAQAGHGEASGDCVRVVSRRDGRELFFIGDVAGHDTRAASFAEELDARVCELAEWTSPGALLMSLNAAIEESWPLDVFVCAVCFVLDRRTGQGTVAVAGQLPPVVRGVSSCRALDVQTGAALGLLADQGYPENDFALEVDDVLVAATDGVTDRFATDSDVLGLDALARLIDEASLDPSDICDSLLIATRRRGIQDDATVLAVAPDVLGRAAALPAFLDEVSVAA